MANEFPKWIKEIYYWISKRNKSINELFVFNDGQRGFRVIIYGPKGNNDANNLPTVQEFIDSLQD